ncbi:MAG: phosphoribosylformylglycinamidine synthase subunit PurQ [Alphaproteobacteria bacterium]
MTAAIIVFPGSNCDRDTAVALEAASGQPPLLIWHRETTLPKVDLIVIPGGFAYGDYLRAGAIAAHSPIMQEVVARAKAGTPTLGICNGFQILTETGLLPGVLTRNASLRFICRDAHLRVEFTDTIFTNHYRPGQVLRVPVAHMDGNYIADDATLRALEDHDQVALRYCTPEGAITDAANPNGARHNIAGIFNRRRNVLGLMPHPERAADILHGGTDGRPMFAAISEALATALAP